MHFTQSNLDTAGIVHMSRRTQRALIIDNPAEIAVFFAKVVTTPSDMPDDWVARNGDKSIFSAFRNVLPEVSTSVRRLHEKNGGVHPRHRKLAFVTCDNVASQCVCE
jgi:hypothetical protein